MHQHKCGLCIAGHTCVIAWMLSIRSLNGQFRIMIVWNGFHLVSSFFGQVKGIKMDRKKVKVLSSKAMLCHGPCRVRQIVYLKFIEKFFRCKCFDTNIFIAAVNKNNLFWGLVTVKSHFSQFQEKEEAFVFLAIFFLSLSLFLSRKYCILFNVDPVIVFLSWTKLCAQCESNYIYLLLLTH